MKNKTSLGLYLHIPFCVQKCAYCDFYSVQQPEKKTAFEQALARQIRQYGEKCRDYTVDTVYFGGGTPSCLGGEALSRLLETIRCSFDLSPTSEITAEANPESMTETFLQEIRRAGFNRLSMGIQSSRDKELLALGRIHTFEQAKAAYDRAKDAGFDNISVDLMYGLPGQDMASWQSSVQNILALEPEHISCYGLKLEAGTPLYHQNPALPDEDEQADMYLEACRLLKQAGYRHYEISNFAKEGRLSRHNSRYWDLSQYLGLGPGAHSYFEGRRFAFDRDLDSYISGHPHSQAEEEIPGFDRQAEYIMLMLRTDTGLDSRVFRQTFGQALEPYAQVLEQYKKLGLTEQIDGRWRLTEAGFLVSNPIIQAVLQAHT